VIRKLAYSRDMTTADIYEIEYCGIGQEISIQNKPGDIKECTLEGIL
jgi:hypothetical protein